MLRRIIIVEYSPCSLMNWNFKKIWDTACKVWHAIFCLNFFKKQLLTFKKLKCNLLKQPFNFNKKAYCGRILHANTMKFFYKIDMLWFSHLECQFFAYFGVSSLKKSYLINFKWPELIGIFRQFILWLNAKNRIKID